MNGSDSVTRSSMPLTGPHGGGGHFIGSKCPECDQKRMSRAGWKQRRGWLVCAQCVQAIDARRAK